MSCTRCPLHRCATQTVFGEGPAGHVAFYVVQGATMLILVLAAMIVWPDIALFLPRLIVPDLMK